MSKLFGDRNTQHINATGHQTPDDLINEVQRLVYELGGAPMMEHEDKFVSDMAERLEKYGTSTTVTPKQLFWLRDLKEKYL